MLMKLLLATVPALALIASVQPGATQNLNQKFGPGWDCGSISATPQYEGEYRDCKKCEAAGQDFYKASNSSGYCVPRGGAGSADTSDATRIEEPAESNLPAVIPITPKSGISTQNSFGHPYDTESTRSSEEALAKARAATELERKADQYFAEAEQAFREHRWVDAMAGYANASLYEQQRQRRVHEWEMGDVADCHETFDQVKSKKIPWERLYDCKKFDFVREYLEGE